MRPSCRLVPPTLSAGRPPLSPELPGSSQLLWLESSLPLTGHGGLRPDRPCGLSPSTDLRAQLAPSFRRAPRAPPSLHTPRLGVHEAGGSWSPHSCLCVLRRTWNLHTTLGPQPRLPRLHAAMSLLLQTAQGAFPPASTDDCYGSAAARAASAGPPRRLYAIRATEQCSLAI